MVRRLHGDRAEVGLRRGEAAAGVGVAALGGQAEHLATMLQRLLLEVDERHDLDRPVGDVRLQKFAAPAPSEYADPDMNHSLRHGDSSVAGNDGARVQTTGVVR
jgi:hypothetical protein